MFFSKTMLVESTSSAVAKLNEMCFQHTTHYYAGELLNFYTDLNIHGLSNWNDSPVELKLDVFLCWPFFFPPSIMTFYFLLKREAKPSPEAGLPNEQNKVLRNNHNRIKG